MADALILIPGMMCDLRVFLPQISALSADRAVMLAPVTQGERIEEIASGLMHQLPARFDLAGFDLGGAVALELLRRAPDRIARLCLIGTEPLAETPAQAAAREPLIVGARAGRLDEALGQALLPDHLAQGPERLKLLDQLRRMGGDLGAEIFIRQSRAQQRRRDQQGTLRRCKAETLLICGEHDALTPPRRHEFMAGLIPHARLKIIKDAGHFPTLEQPAAMTEALREWLGQPLVLR